MGLYTNVFIVSLILLAYIYGVNTVKTTVLNETEICIEKNLTCYDYATITQIKEELNFINISVKMNLTKSQEQKIKNLHIACNNIGCGEGAVRMKYAVFDILGYERPRFSERPAMGWESYDNKTYLPVERDGFGEYIKLNRSWYIWKGAEAYNLTDICNNNTWVIHYNRSPEGYYNINKTFTLNDLNYSNTSKWMPVQKNTNQIYLRHV